MGHWPGPEDLGSSGIDCGTTVGVFAVNEVAVVFVWLRFFGQLSLQSVWYAVGM